MNNMKNVDLRNQKALTDPVNFEVDSSICLRCGACVRDCAFRALRSGADGYPEINKPESCMRCQHCFAICPKGAIEFNGKRAEDSVQIANLELPSAAAVSNWMRVRRSVRHFRDGDVPREKLERILSALGNTPTGCNARALTFTCYSTRESMAAFKAKFLRELEIYRDAMEKCTDYKVKEALIYSVHLGEGIEV